MVKQILQKAHDAIKKQQTNNQTIINNIDVKIGDISNNYGTIEIGNIANYEYHISNNEDRKQLQEQAKNTKSHNLVKEPKPSFLKITNVRLGILKEIKKKLFIDPNYAYYDGDRNKPRDTEALQKFFTENKSKIGEELHEIFRFKRFDRISKIIFDFEFNLNAKNDF